MRRIPGEWRHGGSITKKVGGSRVQLLIGIKNTNLTPVLLQILPSGVGVFRSPFKDRFGSRIIFAGPHPAFTKGNRSLGNEVAVAVFSIKEERELLDSVSDSPESLLDYDETIVTIKKVDNECDPPVEIREMINDNLSRTIRELDLMVLEENQVHFCFQGNCTNSADERTGRSRRPWRFCNISMSRMCQMCKMQGF